MMDKMDRLNFCNCGFVFGCCVVDPAGSYLSLLFFFSKSILSIMSSIRDTLRRRAFGDHSHIVHAASRLVLTCPGVSGLHLLR